AVIKPVKTVTEQIQSLSRGYIDVSKRIKTTSEDEIGRLAVDFNALMETMDSITKFKKAIEEDDELADVYSRLGGEFKYYGFEGFTIYEIANSQNKMKPVYPLALSASEISCNPEIFENCFLCRAKKTGHVVSSIEYPGICKYFLQDAAMEHICVPMMLGGTAGGIVQFLSEKSGMNALHKEAIDGWLNAARRYMEESIPVIETKRLMATLKESALKDALTGLHNRRFLQECAESLVAGALRRGKHIGLIMGDLDFFKQVNDVYGHNTGDALLKGTAEILKNSVRAADLVIRFGGEEFLVVLMDISEGEAIGIAEKIREKMENNKFKVNDGVLKKTISLGISEFPADTESLWQCIKFADVALYEAKNSGRNKCVRFTREMWKDKQF
nr:GGDEF domain-containing protein [Desulfobacteraceae bacterium]